MSLCKFEQSNSLLKGDITVGSVGFRNTAISFPVNYKVETYVKASFWK